MVLAEKYTEDGTVCMDIEIFVHSLFKRYRSDLAPEFIVWKSQQPVQVFCNELGLLQVLLHLCWGAL